ncbi:DUF3592 domain-containing protein [Kangiella shandongensis]|uniref:DUF3592 domain-containing protein n=1 Tax=Kangiella shandongensis TaxID=2763258 RepID=UPI001CBDB827|nr:DUF3592 domain-containing protein [Kangiella shandongensis]
MKKGSGCATIFGGIFFLAGLGIFAWGLSSAYDIWRSGDWVPVSAQVSAIDQTVSTDDEGSTTYGVTGHFQYEFQGQQYQSNQLSFYSGTDNIGHYQQELYYRLNSAEEKGRTVTALVNPEDPTQAVVDRTMRWGMLGFQSIFLLVFGGVGLGIMIFAWRSGRKLQRQQGLQDEHHSEPWLWREEWQSNRLSANTRSGFLFLLFFAIVWNGISLPGVIAVMQEGNLMDKPEKLLVFLFPLVGLILLAIAVTLYLRHKKYGQSQMVLKDMPFAIGGKTRGEVMVRGPLEMNAEAVITLTCQRKYKTGTGKNRSTRTTILWQSDQRTYAENQFDGSHRFEFNFDIPKNQPQSDDSNPSDKIEWVLLIERKQPGVDLKLAFDVPAFVVAHREAIEPAEEDLFMSTDSDNSFSDNGAGDWRRLGIEETINNLGTSYYFPALRQKSAAISMLIFGLVFSGAGVGSYFMGAPIIFLIAFGLIGLLMLYFSLNVMFYRTEVTVGSGTLHVAAGLLSADQTQAIPRSSVKDISSRSNMSVGNKRYYNIYAELNDGKKVVLAKYLTHSADIEGFIDKLKRELGMTR